MTPSQWQLIFLVMTSFSICSSIRVTLHAPPPPPPPPPFSVGGLNSAARILDQVYERSIKGDYKFHFSSSDKQKRIETGQIAKDGAMFVRGQYSFCNNGNFYVVIYRADKNGYHALTKEYFDHECE